MNTRMEPIENRLSKIEGQLSVLLAGKKIEDIARYSKSDNVSKVFDSASAARTMLQGGDLYMDHVTFVNCTIEAPPTKNGTMLVSYVALGESSLSSKSLLCCGLRSI